MSFLIEAERCGVEAQGVRLRKSKWSKYQYDGSKGQRNEQDRAEHTNTDTKTNYSQSRRYLLKLRYRNGFFPSPLKLQSPGLKGYFVLPCGISYLHGIYHAQLVFGLLLLHTQTTKLVLTRS